MGDENEQKQQTPLRMALPVEWHVPEHVNSRYVDNIIVQTKKHDATISFFEIQVPPFVGTPEEVRAFLEKVSPIRAECVSKVVVAADFLPEMIQALQTAYDEYLAVKEQNA